MVRLLVVLLPVARLQRLLPRKRRRRRRRKRSPTRIWASVSSTKQVHLTTGWGMERCQKGIYKSNPAAFAKVPEHDEQRALDTETRQSVDRNQ